MTAGLASMSESPAAGFAAAPPRTVREVFERAAAANGDTRAVWAHGVEHSWRDWQVDANALAAALQDLGVTKGSVVAVQAPNSWEFLVTHVAAALIGAVTFPIHTPYSHWELTHLLERVDLAALVIPTTIKGRDRLQDARAVLAGIGTNAVLIVADLERDRADYDGMPTLHEGELAWDDLITGNRGRTPRPVDVGPDTVLSYRASSGTSSTRPKICVHTHAGQLTNAWHVALDSSARPDDVTLSASPFSHSFGMLSIHIALVAGSGQALIAGWNVDRFVETAIGAKATIAFAVPAQLRDFTAAVERGAITMRQVRTGGAPVPGELVRAIREKLDAEVFVQWGMSEVGAGTYTRPGDADEVTTTTIGAPGGGAEARVVGSDGAPLGLDEVGELCYRAPTIMREYLGDPQLTSAAIDAEGWLHSGDLASMDGAGNVHYAGRITEFINRGGLKFSVVEVENLLSELGGLEQLAVMPIDDERLGQKSILLAKVREGHELTLAEVTAHLQSRGLAKYKWPERLVVVDGLPTTPTGKIARARLSIPGD
jgi:acyl-CoA synthetase (AMP-forming)/AMP-acid ligase II